MEFTETALSVKLQGNRTLVMKTLEKIRKVLDIAYVSDIRQNSRDDGIHLFITVLEEEA